MKGRISNTLRKILSDEQARQELRTSLTSNGGKVQYGGKTYVLRIEPLIVTPKPLVPNK